jgi:hypothetical protein
LSAFLYFSINPSQSGSCIPCSFASIDVGDPSLSLPYTKKKTLVTLRSVVRGLWLSQYE